MAILLLTPTSENGKIKGQTIKGDHIFELSRKQKNCTVKLASPSDELEAEQDTSEAFQGMHCLN